MTEKYETKILNKNFMLIRKNSGSWRLTHNIIETTKQYCLWHATGQAEKYLPISVEIIDYRLEETFEDLFKWGYALRTNWDTCNYQSDSALFRQLVEPLDFNKPYDQAVIDAIRAQFKGKKQVKEVDSSEIEQAVFEE